MEISSNSPAFSFHNLFFILHDSLAVLLSAVASVWVVELVVALVTGGAVLMAKYACMEE